MSKQKEIVDLFAGIGGFSLAAHQVGYKTKAFVEWAEYPQKVLAKNFPGVPIYGDIKQFNDKLESFITNAQRMGWEKRPSEGVQPQEQITKGQNIGNICTEIEFDPRGTYAVTGGFPCQPFSHAGKRKGVDDSRYLWPEMLRSIRILQPTWVIGENVAGLVSMEDGETLERIFADLEAEGYQAEAYLIAACATGAWHKRERIWIIGKNREQRPGPHTSRTYTDSIGSHRQTEQQQREAEFYHQQECIAKGLGKNVSDSDNSGSGFYGLHVDRGYEEADKGRKGQPQSELSKGSEAISNSNSKGLQRREIKGNNGQEQQIAIQFPAGHGESLGVGQTARNTEGAGFQSSSLGQGESKPRGADSRDREREDQGGQPEPGLGRVADGISSWMDSYWDREPEGVSRVTKIKTNRVPRLQSLGNAIVPQVALELFKAIEQWEQK